MSGRRWRAGLPPGSAGRPSTPTSRLPRRPHRRGHRAGQRRVHRTPQRPGPRPGPACPGTDPAAGRGLADSCPLPVLVAAARRRPPQGSRPARTGPRPHARHRPPRPGQRRLRRLGPRALVAVGKPGPSADAAKRLAWWRSQLVEVPVSEQIATEAGALLDTTGLTGHRSVVDAVVVATAATAPEQARVISSDASHSPVPAKAAAAASPSSSKRYKPEPGLSQAALHARDQRDLERRPAWRASNERLNLLTGLSAPLRIPCRLTSENRQLSRVVMVADLAECYVLAVNRLRSQCPATPF